MSKAWPVENLEGNGPVVDNARRVLAVRIAEFYSYTPVIEHPEHSEALHDMRIAAKRLRYSLELFRTSFGKTGDRQIERVKAVQEELGALHDHDVRIALIEDELTALAAEQSALTAAAISSAAEGDMDAITASALRPAPDDPRRGLIALLGREHEGRRQTYVRFRNLWDRLMQEGMRAELVSLSSMPVPSLTQSPETP